MAKELITPEQMAREADRLYLDAALMLTRLDAPMRRAVRLVILEGLSPVRAAERVHRPRQNVNRALRLVRGRLAQVREHRRPERIGA